MLGQIDEFVLDGTVVAWFHIIAKGDTVRGQWFYQKNSVTKRFLWFHCVLKTISRAFSTTVGQPLSGLPAREEQVPIGILPSPVKEQSVSHLRQIKWIDLGPSNNDAVRKIKSKLGFSHSNDWSTQCDYSGAFHDLPVATSM